MEAELGRVGAVTRQPAGATAPDPRVLTSPEDGSPRDPRPMLALLAAVVGGIGLAAALALGQPPGPLPSPSGTDGSAVATDAALYDVDGIPLRLAGEPVLRGAAIAARAARGGPSPFLVAGWEIQDPASSCAPGPIHCDFTSLVDAPGDQRAAGVVTLERPAGTEFSFDWERRWAGGFHVLRVRAACTFWDSTCLVVDEEIGPAGALPTTPDGFGRDGLPLTVDGQPVARGVDVARRLEADPARLPAWVAGRAVEVPPTDELGCPDPVTWESHGCPVVQLADPDAGLPFGARAPTLAVSRWGLQRAWDPDATWPGGYVVLLATARTVIGSVSPPGVTPAPTPQPMPSIALSSWATRKGVVLEIDGRRVRSGERIGRYLETSPSEAFLVTGVLEPRPCAACADGMVSVLVEPRRKGADGGATAFPLLRSDGSLFEPGSAMVWTDPSGIVVLEVRPFDGACLAFVACIDALEVVGVVSSQP